MNNISAHLENITQKIVEQVHPKKIYLFGSFAKGTYNENSDIDICIVSNNNGKSKISIAQEAYFAIFPLMNKEIDIVVLNEEDFTAEGYGSEFSKAIQKEGVVLYEQ